MAIFSLSPHARYLLVPGRIPFFQALHFEFGYRAFYSVGDRHFTKAPKAGYNYQHPNRKTEHYITAFFKIEPGQCETERLCLQMSDSLPPARVPVKVSRGIDGHKKSRPESLLFLALSGPCLAPHRRNMELQWSVLPCSDATNVPQVKGTFKDI